MWLQCSFHYTMLPPEVTRTGGQNRSHQRCLERQTLLGQVQRTLTHFWRKRWLPDKDQVLADLPDFRNIPMHVHSPLRHRCVSESAPPCFLGEQLDCTSVRLRSRQWNEWTHWPPSWASETTPCIFSLSFLPSPVEKRKFWCPRGQRGWRKGVWVPQRTTPTSPTSQEHVALD